MSRIQSITEKQVKKLLRRKGIYGTLEIIKVNSVYGEFLPEEGQWDELRSEVVYGTLSRNKRIFRMRVNYIERNYEVEFIG